MPRFRLATVQMAVSDDGVPLGGRSIDTLEDRGRSAAFLVESGFDDDRTVVIHPTTRPGDRPRAEPRSRWGDAAP